MVVDGKIEKGRTVQESRKRDKKERYMDCWVLPLQY